MLKWTIIALLLYVCDCAKILIVTPNPSFDQKIIYHNIITALHTKGHDLYVISADPIVTKAPKNNYTKIDVQGVDRYYDKKHKIEHLKTNRLISWFNKQLLLEKVAHYVFGRPQIQDLIQGNLHFDLMIMQYDAHDSFKILSDIFECPIIGINSNNLLVETDGFINPFYSNVFEENLHERAIKAVLAPLVRFLYRNYLLSRTQDIVKKYFPNNTRCIDDIQNNLKVVLSYDNQVLSEVFPNVLPQVAIGGIFTNKANKKQIPTVSNIK